MSKEMPKLARIADCVRAGAIHPGSVLPGPIHQSLPIPMPGPGELRIAFLYSRAEIREAIDACGLPWREDETNADLRFDRNCVRAQVLPVLRSLNPRAAEALGRVSALAGRDEDLLSRLAD